MLYRDFTPVAGKVKNGNFPNGIMLKPKPIFCEVCGGDVTHKKDGKSFTHFSIIPS